MLSSQLPDIAEENSSERVYVALGNSIEKAVGLLNWVFESLGTRQICLLHVHRPSPLIPTLLGKLPASQANAEVVSAFRSEENERTKKLFDYYLIICRRAKVEATIVTIESDQVHKGIVELVNRHGVRKLVMGAVKESCMKVKKSSCKENYAAKHAPLFCEIRFINKGKCIWTREASENSNPLQVSFSSTNGSCASGCTSTEMRVSSGSDPKVEEESSYSHIEEVSLEAEALGNEAFEELLKCKTLELEAMEAFSKVKIYESAIVHEVKLRKEAEDALNNTIQDQEKLLTEKVEVARKLERTMRNVALLDIRAQEANRRCEEASGELKLIQTSILSLRQEEQRIRRQKMEAVHWLERWRNPGQAGTANCNGFLGITEELPELAEFSLSDLQTATCNFSESFKLGQGGCGQVYKGEMLGRTVAIKRLHPNNMQGQSEFQKEVQVLGKLQHPHLVTLLGACPEAWSLVYEYLPNGSLQDRLFQKSNIAPLTWKIRTRIIAEISSALCFLHSSKPEKIVHGDLKPQNILLNSELGCKICEFGICRLVTEDSLYEPRFHWSTIPKGSFPYTDPEFQRIGVLTPKSDIYAFGVIILQLLTGKPPAGLVGEVRRTRKLASILDPSAEWPMIVARRLVDLALQFCELSSRGRPDLTPTLVRELEQLHVSEERPVPSFFLCPILQEIMHDPQVAADGFTYEGDALRGWLANGRETSPMTNLRLDHLHLTPNHALRLAIQDWLCKY
ncbi:PREDICTED: U-box domain-containing protein 33-like [Populus euphratica]|uniref:RING-type E3 ubiquitin transferase n=1 Tax=Populus euphratica TaxID=75702 RepID=A0AAJ6UTX5_POPEU|nr:PREDICTED: U-box domain-containing protein 33-like [Populus euphratica]